MKDFCGAFRKFSLGLNLVVTILTTGIYFLYSFVILNATLAIIFAGIFAVASLLVFSMVAYNTTMEKDKGPKPSAEVLQKQATRAKIFLAIMIPCIILNTISIGIAVNVSLTLLGNALTFVPPDVTYGVSLSMAILAALASLAYNIIQTHGTWEKIKKVNVGQESNAEEQKSLLEHNQTLSNSNTMQHQVNVTNRAPTRLRARSVDSSVAPLSPQHAVSNFS